MLLHSFGRFGIILQPQALDDLLQKRRQIFIHIRDQIAVFGFGDLVVIRLSRIRSVFQLSWMSWVLSLVRTKWAA